MIFAKDLLLKGAAGLALCAGVGAGGWYVITQNKEETLETLTKAIGLNCIGVPTETTGVQCTKKDGSENIKVKKDTSFDVSNITGGSIKAYKVKSSEEYNKDFKFVIEGGDITGTNSNKLEQFETYEIKKEDTGDNWYLTKKKDAKDGIKKALGLPDDCQFPTAAGQDGCDISGDKFKKIKFDVRGAEEGEAATGSPKLKISTTTESEFPLGFKFVLVSSTNTTISNSLTIKANTNTEFKIKKGEGNAITLEKAWSVTDLAAKVGLTCPEGTEGECTLNENGINVNNEESSKFTNASRGANNDQKKVKFEVNKENFNQGFKFYVDSTTDDICLDSGTDKKIERKGDSDNVHYQILKNTDNNWYLTKKSS